MVTEWIWANTCIYNKGDLEHKDRDKRARLFQEKAEELGDFRPRTFKLGMLRRESPIASW